MYGETCKVLKFRGTNKMLFQEGKAEHYGWIGLGGEYCANEITCAFLSAQLERAEIYFDARTAVWLRYQQLLSNFDKNHLIDYVSDRVSAGNFYIKVPKGANRSEILSGMRRIGIDCRNHFYPLHLTKAGRDYGYFDRRLPVTEVEHERVIRLPSHIKVSEAEQERVIKILLRLVENSQSESQNA
jgi:dTDP-4-amino-4,6-dideoxygalactose transaminase